VTVRTPSMPSVRSHAVGQPGQARTSPARRTVSFRPALAAVAVPVVIVLLAILMASAARPSEERVVHASTVLQGAGAETASGATIPFTHTMFLPIVGRTPVPNEWSGEYFANSNLSGDPAYTTRERRVDFDWGGGAPAGLPANGFSVRWTGHWGFEAGEYTFFAYADDGIRLWLDGQPLLDHWGAGAGFYEETVQVATEGLHQVKLEYFEGVGDAAIYLLWRRTDLYPVWDAEYYANPWVDSPPVGSDTDTVIQVDWGLGCPAGLSCDSFSVEWWAAPLFPAGTHRIYVYADEGYRLYLDGAWRGEGGWEDGQPGGAEDDWYDLHVSTEGSHLIAYQVHDRGGPAEARLWIENIDRPDWTAEYFNNKHLSGTPVKTVLEGAVFHDWGLGRPRAGVPIDRFSVRWTGQRYFHAGSYIFTLFADDGVRLRVDGELLVDEWEFGRGEYSAPITYLSTGFHDVVVEYYDEVGEAEVRLWWE
jgi:hypothetical protein